MTILLIRVDFDSQPLRLTNGEGYKNSPDGYYDGALLRPPSLKRALTSHSTSGQMIEIDNINRKYDWLYSEAVDGRMVHIATIPDHSSPWQDHRPLSVGLIHHLEVRNYIIQLVLSDPLERLKKPLVTTSYLGNNQAPNGIEGSADLKGQAKPFAAGYARNISPIEVNSHKMIYHYHSGDDVDVMAAYDNGVLLNADQPYASLADLETNAPQSGRYRVLKSHGLIRLNAHLTKLTLDVMGDATGAGMIIYNLARRILADDDIDRAAFDAMANHQIGFFNQRRGDIWETMQKIAKSLNAWLAFTKAGRLSIGYHRDGENSPYHLSVNEETLSKWALIAKPPQFNGGDSLPVWQCRVSYARNWTVQEKLDSNVPNGNRTFIKRDVAWAEAQNTQTQADHPLAREMEIDTLLTSETDAQNLANQLLQDNQARRDSLRFELSYDDLTRADLDLGQKITVRGPLLNFDNGVVMQIESLEIIGPRSVVGVRHV